MKDLWYILELRIFYGYVLSGILMILLSRFFGMNKSKRHPEALPDKKEDFIEKYHECLQDFNLHSLQLITTLAIVIEFAVDQYPTLRG